MVNEMDATQDWGQTSMRGVYRTVYLDKQFLSPDPDSPSSKQNKTTKQKPLKIRKKKYLSIQVLELGQQGSPISSFRISQAFGVFQLSCE